MTIEDVRKAVENIRSVSGDDERAHSYEDSLREAVLRAIVDGTCEDPVECARLALSTDEISFERWCA